MKETVCDKTCKRYFLITFLGITVLTLVILVGMTGASPFAYIANYGDNTTSIIDTSDNTVVATVSVGFGPYGVAVSPDGSKVYVTNFDSNTISVINTSTHIVTDNVSVGTYPRGIAVSPDGAKVYVASVENLSVINTTNNTVTATVNVGTSYGVAVNPAGTNVYVTD